MIPVERVKGILRAYGLKPKKRLGQHFLLDDGLMWRLADHADLSSRDVVLDVGAGLGFLTEVLASRSGLVIAVEIDRGLVKVLKDRLSGFPNVEVIEGDVFDVELPVFNKAVSAPPYNVISRLIFWLLSRLGHDLSVLIVQEELARRLIASPCSDDYGRLTVMAYYKADVDLLEPVPRDSFWPKPDVDSVAVKLVGRPAPFAVEDEALFAALVRGLFSHRNKLLRGALKLTLMALGVGEPTSKELAITAPHADRRVRELSPEDLAEITNYVAQKAIRWRERGRRT